MSFTGFVDPGFGKFGVDKSGLAPITKFVNTAPNPKNTTTTTEAKKNKSNTKVFRYPLKNIDASDDFLKIQSFEYVPPGLNLSLDTFSQRSSDDVVESGGYGPKKIRGTVILPIPENIQDSNQVSWGGGEMGPLQTAALGLATKVIKDDNPIEGIADNVNVLFNKLNSAAKTGTTQSMVQTFFASEATKALLGSGDFQQNLSRQTGSVFNSNIELLFSGVSLRAGFSFDFNMIPRSKKESDQIKDIIRFFKSEMAAKKGAETGAAAGLFIKSPSVFKLQYMSGGKSHPFLNQFKICALTNMSVNYTGSGTYATYSDATPVHMVMTLAFQELTPIYNEDYVNKDGEFKPTLTGTGY